MKIGSPAYTLFYYLLVIWQIAEKYVFQNTAIFCNALRDLLGAARYSLPNDGGRYPFGTVATYSCGVGSAIVGGSVSRTCIGDGSSTLGSFDGTEPMCKGV